MKEGIIYLELNPISRIYYLTIKIPNGEEIIVYNLKIFCKKYKLNYNSFRNAIYKGKDYKKYKLIKKEKIK